MTSSGKMTDRPAQSLKVPSGSEKHPKQKIKFGDAGDRTPCLSHAKRALYHLSYIPTYS